MHELTKMQAYREVQKLVPLIEEWYAKRKLDFDLDNRFILKEVWEKYLMRGNILSFSCDSCIKEALDVVYSWYEREKPGIEAEIASKHKGDIEKQRKLALQKQRINGKFVSKKKFDEYNASKEEDSVQPQE